MSIIQGNAKQGSTRGFYDFPIEQSLRFNDDDSAYLSDTFGTNTSERIKTLSLWVKRSKLGSGQTLFSATTSGFIEGRLEFTSSDELQFVDRNATDGTSDIFIRTNALFRDPSAWYHIVLELDTTNTVANLYVNGVSQTFQSGQNVKATNYDIMCFRSDAVQYIGSNVGSSSFFDGYMAEVNFIDGTAYDADDFGELKNGVWIPKDPTGLTYGTNGFRLSFADDAEVEAFNTVLYRGNGTSQSVTGMGFQPDLVWIKDRILANSNWLVDSVRGVGYELSSNQTIADYTTYTRFTSFDSDGFSVSASGSNQLNQSSSQYVAWGWKAGDSNVSNTDGSIPSTVRANTTYGFSIVSYTGNGSTSQTVGHGLGDAPDFVIYKNRDDAGTSGADNGNWIVQSTALGVNEFLNLNNTNAAGTDSGYFGGLRPTDTLLRFGSYNSVNGSGDAMIAYCWAEKAGYSKFGSYSGGTNPQTITTTFKPAFILIKAASGSSSPSTQNWYVFDNTRDVSGDNLAKLYPNLSNAESTAADNQVEFLDTGFKLKSTNDGTNASGNTYIYAAFADTREAAFWLDQSGNDNDWQPVNLDHNDTVADSPTDNFATWNPLFDEASGHTFADGNLKVTTKTTGYGVSVATIVPTAGKFYAEITPSTIASTLIGIRDVTIFGGNNAFVTQNDSNGLAYFSGGALYGTNVSTDSTGGASYTSGDVIGIAINYDDGEVRWYKNGSIQYTKTGLDLTNMALAVGDVNNSSSSTMTANFGQQPFKYDPPA